MTAHAHAAMPQPAGQTPNTFLCVGFFDPEHVVRQMFAKAAMNVADAFSGYGAAAKIPFVDPALHGDVCFGFELQVAFLRVGAVVVFKGSLDVYGMCIM